MSAPDPQDHRAPGGHLPTAQEERARKRRILATGLALAAFVVVIFVVSLSRLYSNMVAG